MKKCINREHLTSKPFIILEWFTFNQKCMGEENELGKMKAY